MELKSHYKAKCPKERRRVYKARLTKGWGRLGNQQRSKHQWLTKNSTQLLRPSSTAKRSSWIWVEPEGWLEEKEERPVFLSRLNNEKQQWWWCWGKRKGFTSQMPPSLGKVGNTGFEREIAALGLWLLAWQIHTGSLWAKLYQDLYLSPKT